MFDPSLVQCASTQVLWKFRSVSLINDLSLMSNISSVFSVPLMRYIMSSHLALPVKTIVLVERPYRTNIHPYAASAMSYDLHKSGSIMPSTAVLATDLRNRVGADWEVTERWFRDSWMYIASGTFLINVCCFEEFMGNSLNERVAVESFVRDMVVASYDMSGIAVDLVALGNPAISSANRIRSNISDRKKKLKVHKGVNPAGLRHKFGDLTSPDITVGSIELSRVLHRAILRSLTTTKCTKSDFDIMSASKQAATKNRIINDHRDLDEDMENITQFFKSGGKYQGPVSDEQIFVSFRKNLTKMINTLIEERVLMKLADLRENDTAAKGAYSSGHRNYEAKPFRTGSSSEVSGISKGKITPTVTRAKFMDEEDDEPSTPSKTVPVKEDPPSSTIMTPASSTPQTPKQPSSKKPQGTSEKSASGRSNVGGNRSVSRMKFIEEEDVDVIPIELTSEKPDVTLTEELEKMDLNDTNKQRPTSPVMMNADECADMATVGEFLHSSGAEYGFPGSVVQEVNEAATTGRASSDVAKKVLEAVREMRSSGESTVEDDLGFVTGTCNRNSPLMKQMLEWAN